MSTTPMAIPLGKEDFLAGGILNNEDVEIKAVQFSGWDYNGAIQESVAAVRMELEIIDERGKRTGEVKEQFLSCGPKLGEVNPSDDGYMLLPGSKAGLTKNSNFWLWLESAWKKGMPGDFIKTGSIKPLMGVRFHATQLPAPKREGLDTKEGKTYLAVEHFISAPWLGKPGTAAAHSPRPQAGSSAAAVPPAATSAPAQASGTEPAGESSAEAGPERKALEIATDLVSAAKEPIAGPSALKVLAFRAMGKLPAAERNAAIKFIGNPEWLSANGFTVSETAVTI
jgi:hypothetical protein